MISHMPGVSLISRDSSLLSSSQYSSQDQPPTLYHHVSPADLSSLPSSVSWASRATHSIPDRSISSPGSKRTFSSRTHRINLSKKGEALQQPPSIRPHFSMFDGHDNTDDLSTRHVDTYSSPLQSLWQSLPGSKHFVLSDNLKFIINICMWYISSSLTNNIGKQILTSFKYPVTLTFIQFALVGMWCFLVGNLLSTTHIRSPTQEIVKTITPLAVFLIVGHVFSSIAISRVPVSLVHTIKALAPLFTVLFYRFIFQVHYTPNVYISLLPLTLGVILACSFTYSNSMVGLSCALGSCFVFVTQNIFSKKLLFKEAKMGDRNPNKLDKINVLFYSSFISCVLMIPLWLYSDGSSLMSFSVANEGALTKTQLIVSLFLNGTMNFGQNWFAFTTLSMTSPVTYSIFSLLKRIFVIVMSIVWFGQQVTITQSLGIMMTFVGLWMYQKAKRDVDRGETKVREKSLDVLPTEEIPLEDIPRHRMEGFTLPVNQAKKWASNLIPQTRDSKIL
ncbi:triose-phosphate transporter family-domain-containing protein [Phycomyces nitens]|nr:triose-phosphate transporter family-domain-containing protein [Phycomyces nitens]